MKLSTVKQGKNQEQNLFITITQEDLNHTQGLKENIPHYFEKHAQDLSRHYSEHNKIYLDYDEGISGPEPFRNAVEWFIFRRVTQLQSQKSIEEGSYLAPLNQEPIFRDHFNQAAKKVLLAAFILILLAVLAVSFASALIPETLSWEMVGQLLASSPLFYLGIPAAIVGTMAIATPSLAYYNFSQEAEKLRRDRGLAQIFLLPLLVAMDGIPLKVEKSLITFPAKNENESDPAPPTTVAWLDCLKSLTKCQDKTGEATPLLARNSSIQNN